MRRNLEIPCGKRKKMYRFFELLPGLISYGLIIALFILSFINPILGSIFLAVFVMLALVKAIGIAYRVIQGYKTMKQVREVTWSERIADLKNPRESYERLHNENNNSFGFIKHLENLKMMSVEPKEYPNPDEIYHLVIMTAYNEGKEILEPSIQAVLDTTFPSKRILFALAYEERGGEKMAQTAAELAKKYQDKFFCFEAVKHPQNLRNEIIGKGPNLTFAGEYMAKYIKKYKLKTENIIVTSLDSDNRMSKQYLDVVAYEFITRKNRQHLSYQPVSLFTNNIWDAPAPTRIIAISNSFFNIISTMRPHTLRNFASHSQPLMALEGMGFWSKRTIVEDGHQYWRSLFYFNGDYDVLPIRVPIYQDAVLDITFWKTVKAQFIQLRRWYYGASDVAYVGTRLFADRQTRGMPFAKLLPKFLRLLDGHVSLAVSAPLIAFGSWVPMLVNSSARSMVGYNLPSMISVVQTVAMVGLVITILTSMKIIPEMPEKYRKEKRVSMFLQWLLMPVTSIFYQSLAAFYAQTRLMTGKYMEKFDVTRKVVK